MKLSIATIIAAFLSFNTHAQHFEVIASSDSLQTKNIRVEKLAEDELSSTFAIWVLDSVPAHYHEHHTETVTVLSGEGVMTLGNVEFVITAGSVVFIPKGTAHSVLVSSDVPLAVISVQSPRFDGSDRVFLK